MHDFAPAQAIEVFRRVETALPLAPAVDRARGRAVLLRDNRLLYWIQSRQPVLLGVGKAPAGTTPVFLGLDERDDPLFSLEVGEAGEPELERMGLSPAEVRFADPMMELGRLAGPMRELVVTALALARWSAEHRFCNVCGGTLGWDEGRTKSCDNPAGPHRHFPRIDPATIMLVHDGERVLLGRQAAWPSGMYSTLAGFIEPGEAAEDAVIREVFEEVGVRVADVRYFASEAWPFPRSLMLGFFARATTFDVRVGAELDDARWFARAELAALQDGVATRRPFFDTIARRLIADWLQRTSV